MIFSFFYFLILFFIFINFNFNFLFIFYFLLIFYYLFLKRNLRSPHVVFFYGACLQPSMCMVLEFCHKGSLYDVLNSKEDITWKRVFKAAKDTIKGLSCLHNWKPQIVHRDMKSLNLLVLFFPSSSFLLF